MLRPLLVLCILAPAAAHDLDERHRPIVPRTAEEVAREAAILAPPTDFIRPEPCVKKSGGAATVRARMSAGVFSQLSANMPFAPGRPSPWPG